MKRCRAGAAGLKEAVIDHPYMLYRTHADQLTASSNYGGGSAYRERRALQIKQLNEAYENGEPTRIEPVVVPVELVYDWSAQ